MNQFHRMDLAKIQQMLDDRAVTNEELCRFFLDRIRQYGMSDDLNCVYALNENAVNEAKAMDERKQEKLPLRGSFVLVKDNIDVVGMMTTAGSVALARHRVYADADIIRILKAKGAVILGKTNMTEFANFLTPGMPGGFSSLSGQVISAYGREKPVSGSSSGSAVAMSAGLCTFAVGTDTSFSVVACAAENGVIGYKPPVGKISVEGIVPITHYFDSAGFMTKSMDDLLLILSALFRTEIHPNRKKRIRINDFGYDQVSDPQKARYAEMLSRLENSGYQIEHTEIGNTFNLKELMLRTFAAELDKYLEKTGDTIRAEDILQKYGEDPDSYAPYGTRFLEASLQYRREKDNSERIAQICVDRKCNREEISRKLTDTDACLMTGPTCIMHYIGFPSISVPFTTADEDGMPRSMILFGADEERLLSVAADIEKLRHPIRRTGYITEEEF